MSKLVKKFVKGEEGATMIEYGLMVALIAVVVMATVALVGTALDAMFLDVSTKLTTP